VAVIPKAAEDDITYKHPVEGQHLQRLKGLVKKKQHQYNTHNKEDVRNQLGHYKQQQREDQDQEVN
jgi:hypothetical protein